MDKNASKKKSKHLYVYIDFATEAKKVPVFSKVFVFLLVKRATLSSLCSQSQSVSLRHNWPSFSLQLDSQWIRVLENDWAFSDKGRAGMTQCKIEFTYASHCVSKNMTPRRMLKKCFRISQMNRQIQMYQICIFGAYFGAPNMVKWGVPEKILQNAIQTRWS